MMCGAGIERLESRRLLAAAAVLSSTGLLHVTGTEDADSLAVTTSTDQIVVFLNGKSSNFLSSKVKSVLVEGEDGPDTISSGVDVPTTLRGGDGEDYVEGESSKTVVLTDYMDTVVLPNGGMYKYNWEGSSPAPKIIDFDGAISTNAGDTSINITVHLLGVPAPSGGISYVPGLTLGFTDAADKVDFRPNGYSVALDLGGGNDHVSVADFAKLSSGTITVMGGNGNDTLESRADGKNVLVGCKGNDTLISGPGSRDTLIGARGTDTVDYTARTKPLNISLDNHSNDGEAGEHDNVDDSVENIIGGSGNDRIIGDSAANSLVGGAGNDTIHGMGGHDTLVGGTGKDHLFGDDGDDFISARWGSRDTLDGGDGSDRAKRDDGPNVFDSVKNIESFI